MSLRTRLLVLILIMTVVVVIVAGLTNYVLYQAAVVGERERLIATVQSQARLIESVSRFDAEFSRDYPGGPEAATLAKIIAAHEQYSGFGETGEFTLARTEGDDIVFLLSHRHHDLENLQPVSIESELAEPMRAALSGLSGVLTGLDYRGEVVLAAYEPVAELDLGIVAKIDMAEIREPFLDAAIMAGGAALVVVLFGAGLFVWVTNPWIRHLRQHSVELEEMVDQRTEELRAVAEDLQDEMAERREMQERLLRQERLAALGELAGGVGHELRNPLGAIKNVAYYLKMVLKEPEPKVRESLDLLEREVGRSDRIISSLLDFARQRPPSLQAVNVNEVIEGALFQMEVPENIELVTELSDGLPRIPADPNQLAQVFANIALNGIQAMPEGGRLTVRSEYPGAGWVAVAFTDTGTGLTEQDLSLLFQPLYTTKAAGIGLGLPISRTIVDGHGGVIDVESEPGAGTTFSVRLPVALEGEREAVAQEQPGAA